VIVIGATNIPEILDPAFAAAGAVSIEKIEISVPEHAGAAANFADPQRGRLPAGHGRLPCRKSPSFSHGFVGADLEALLPGSGDDCAARVPGETFRWASMPRPSAETECAAGYAGRIFWPGLKDVEPSATREFFIEKKAKTAF